MVDGCNCHRPCNCPDLGLESDSVNRTSHGRWGRYRITDQGEKEKLCNGPLHPPEGAWLPLRSFWVYKTGKRKGKPLCRCQECEKVGRGRDSRTSGWIRVEEVWWIFLELQRRLGKTETLRRLHISNNFWSRAEKKVYENMRRTTASKAVKLLYEVRYSGEVRHRLSIIHGAKERGRTEKTPHLRMDFYHPTTDEELLYRRNQRITKRNAQRGTG